VTWNVNQKILLEMATAAKECHHCQHRYHNCYRYCFDLSNPDEPAAVTGEVAAAETVVAAAAAAASETSVAGHFDPATQEAKRADSPMQATTSSVPDRREVVGAVVEGFGAAAAVVAAAAAAADDQPAVAGSGSCHKVPVDEAAVAAIAAAVAAATVAQAGTDDVMAVPDGAAGIQWAKTAVVDNESGGQVMVEGLVLWDSPMAAYFYKACHVEEGKVACCVLVVANFGCNVAVVGFEPAAVENHQV
jgi:hypothetical protein